MKKILLRLLTATLITTLCFVICSCGEKPGTDSDLQQEPVGQSKYPISIVTANIDGFTVKLSKGATVKTPDGADWFTITDVNSATATVGFDGYTYIDVIIRVHKGNFPEGIRVLANGNYYDNTFSLNKYGTTKDGLFSFAINVFDVNDGDMFLVYKDEDMKRIEKTDIEILSSDVEVLLTERTGYNDPNMEITQRD